MVVFWFIPGSFFSFQKNVSLMGWWEFWNSNQKNNKTKDNQKLIKSRRESRAGTSKRPRHISRGMWDERQGREQFHHGRFFLVSRSSKSLPFLPHMEIRKTERDPTMQLNKQKEEYTRRGLGKKDKKKIVYLVSWPKLMGPEFSRPSVRPRLNFLSDQQPPDFFCFVWFFSLMLQSSHAPMDSILISRRRKGAISNRLLPHVNHHQQQQSRLTSLPFKNSTSPAGLEREKINSFVRVVEEDRLSPTQPRPFSSSSSIFIFHLKTSSRVVHISTW